METTRFIKNEDLEDGPSKFHQMMKILLNFSLNVYDIKDQDLAPQGKVASLSEMATYPCI